MYTRSRGFMKDMDKTTLLKMRDDGMTNAEIAVSLGCSKQTIYNLIGSMPPEMRRRIFQENGANNMKAAKERREGGDTVERKAPSMMPQREAEPVKAVLAVKKTDTHLTGTYKNYVVAADRSCIDVETDDGRTLLNIPADMLGTFIEELTTIQKNMNTVQSVQFWG